MHQQNKSVYYLIFEVHLADNAFARLLEYDFQYSNGVYLNYFIILLLNKGLNTSSNIAF